MKNLFLFFLLPFFMLSCDESQKNINVDSLRADSAIKSQMANSTNDLPISSNDSSHALALPQVMEGDLLFQNATDEQSLAFGKATKSKYNNIGLVYMRPKDQLYMVFDVRDSLHSVPLTDWVNSGNGQHIAILRLKNANRILNEKEIKLFRATAKPLKGRKYDPYFSWGNDAFYSSELVWKLYKEAASIELSTPGKLSQLDLTDPLVKQQMKNKYGSSIPKEEQLVTPNDLYNSQQLEIIYEK